MRKTPSLLLLLLPGLAVAQQVKYVPPTHANVEGSSTNTYPFGRATAGLQVLVDAPWVTQGVGFVNAVSFRANGLAAGSAAVQGYSGGYRVTCWNTTVNSASLTTNPTTNAGSATPTVEFNGTLTLPTVTPSVIMPEPFSVKVAFTTPFPFSGSAGNFLMQVETSSVPVATGWGIDAIVLNKSTITGWGVKVATGCSYLSNKLNVTLGSSELLGAVPGGSVGYKLATTSAGSWPTVLAILGSSNALAGYPIDLSALGMPACALNIDPLVTQTVLESSGAYANVTWLVPNLPALTGGTVYVQNLGLASPSSLLGAVTSDTYAVTLGDATAPAAQRAHSIFSTNLTTWNIGGTGGYHPILKLEGVLP